MTLNQLRYFQAVCKCDGVGRAAEYLQISQPSISNSIRELEKEFGVMLFSRQNKRLLLTKEGSVFLELTNQLLEKADSMQKTMGELGDNKILVLGVPPMLGSRILPVLYGEFFKKHPDFKISIIEGDRKTLLQMLEENTINMAFLPHDKPVDSRYHSQPLFTFDNVCCVHRQHRFAKKSAINIQDLKDEPLVLFKDSFFQTQRILDQFTQNHMTPNILLDTVQVSTLQSVISSGLAVGFMFSFLLDSTPKLVGIPLDPPMRMQVSLVWNRSEYITGNMNRLIEFVKGYPMFHA